MSIVITAPTGNIGSALVQELLGSGAELTLIARDPARLSEDVRRRTTVKQGDLTDAEFLRSATEGAKALFWLSPPNFVAPNVKQYYAGIHASAATAVKANRIPHVVFISGGGGGNRDLGTASNLFDGEDALNATEASVLSLRCGLFMENFLMYLPTLKSDGVWYGLNSPDFKAPFVATKDIAAVAARHLLNREWSGKSILPVHGAEDLTMTEAAQILTETLEKPIHYVQVPAEAVEQSMIGMGASPDSAASLVKMFQGFENGSYEAEPRTPESTTPTTFAEWSRNVLKPLI